MGKPCLFARKLLYISIHPHLIALFIFFYEKFLRSKMANDLYSASEGKAHGSHKENEQTNATKSTGQIIFVRFKRENIGT